MTVDWSDLVCVVRSEMTQYHSPGGGVEVVVVLGVITRFPHLPPLKQRLLVPEHTALALLTVPAIQTRDEPLSFSALIR